MHARILVLCLSLTAPFASAFAGECKLNVERTACPGKESESFKKCDGKPSCAEVKKTGTAASCAKEALKACENVGDRQKITKSKKISAEFDGKPVENGKNFCEESRPDFNKCG
jgi:hypothetical protein